MTDVLWIGVIYHSPADYPGKYVLRGQTVGTGHRITVDPEPVGVVDTLDAARALLPPGLTCVGRDPADEPQIVECWL